MLAQTPSPTKFAVAFSPAVFTDLRPAAWFTVVFLPTMFAYSGPATFLAGITHFASCDTLGATWDLLDALGVDNFVVVCPGAFGGCHTLHARKDVFRRIDHIVRRLGGGGVTACVLLGNRPLAG